MIFLPTRNSEEPVFVVTKLDRLARSVHDLMQITQTLQDKNCDLQVLDQELDTQHQQAD